MKQGQNPRIKPALDVRELDGAFERALDTGDREALARLCALSKDARAKARLNENPRRPELRTLLQSPEPKVRKNAARLLGALYQPGDLIALKQALFCEKTLFVTPSIILALGNGGEEAQRALEEYGQGLKAPDGPEEQKHYDEISAALSAALSRCRPRQKRQFLGLPQSRELVLVPAPGCRELLLKEAREKGVKARKCGLGIAVNTEEYQSVFALRCFEEVLIPLGTCPAPEGVSKEALARWARAAAAAAKDFAPLLASTSTGGPPYEYRIELRTKEGQRAECIRALARELGNGGGLVNAPSGYMAELRAYVEKTTALYAKLCLPQDPRFQYRKRVLPASIAPATAAALIRFARPYMKANARVLDPCCGSGTLLVERERAGVPVSELLGVDIDSRAVSAARENAAAARSKARFLGGDCRNFRPRQPFDELYANLPFGTRVGTHDSSVELYRALVGRLDKLLAPGGVAVFYTTQRAALVGLLNRAGYQVREQFRFFAGGLLPYGIIASKREEQ